MTARKELGALTPQERIMRRRMQVAEASKRSRKRRKIELDETKRLNQELQLRMLAMSHEIEFLKNMVMSKGQRSDVRQSNVSDIGVSESGMKSRVSSSCLSTAGSEDSTSTGLILLGEVCQKEDEREVEKRRTAFEQLLQHSFTVSVASNNSIPASIKSKLLAMKVNLT